MEAMLQGTPLPPSVKPIDQRRRRLQSASHRACYRACVGCDYVTRCAVLWDAQGVYYPPGVADHKERPIPFV